MKKQLSNGCSRSAITVSPKNWKTTSMAKKPWMIFYRFHCPGQTGRGTRYPKGVLVTHRGMNEYKTADERRAFCKGTIEAIREDLDDCDYNPITGYKKEMFEAVKTDYEIHPDTPLIEAWRLAYEKRKVSEGVKKDLRSVRKYSEIAAKNLRIHMMPVKDVRRRHMKALLDQLKVVKRDTWTANNYNFYRSHLSILFDELCEWETIENNPMEKVSRMKHAVAKRATLTKEQRIAIDQGLRKDNYRFWLFMQLFFYSGARSAELMNVKDSDVNLKDQTVKYLIKKGTSYRQEYRPIPNNAVNLWEQALVGITPGQYVFSRGLKPGDGPIKPYQITHRWQKWVKLKKDKDGNKKYGENIPDFYSLKHSHSSEVSKKVGTRLAALHNQHTETILKRNYDTEGANRDMEILKGIDIEFAPE